MATWIARLEPSGSGPRLAVKDAIDVAGVPTTAGCAAVAEWAGPAVEDAACVRTARAAGARITGKTNLHELCYGVTGINPWYGTPVNPLDPSLVPGGSSSGSAVAVADDEVDVGYGTDTGGSVRIPAACCGIAGLKTTWGRVPLTGVWPLAPTLDTVGPLARDVAGLVTGMRLLEPGFAPAGEVAVVGRVRVAGVLPEHEAAVDRALASWGIQVLAVTLPGWAAADAAFEVVIATEAYSADRHLVERHPDGVGRVVARRVRDGAAVTSAAYDDALAARSAWQSELARVFERVSLLVLPTMAIPVPAVADLKAGPGMNLLSRTFNLSGSPALSLPLGGAGNSLQLVGPAYGEELLCAAGADVQRAVSS